VSITSSKSSRLSYLPINTGNLTVPCCDCCDPSILNQVIPPPREKQRRITKPKKGKINAALQSDLTTWREEICTRDYSHVLWAPNAFLDDETIASIASRPDIANQTQLAMLLDAHWGFWGQYGQELLIRIQRTVPVLAAVSQASKTRKRRTSNQTNKSTTDTPNQNVACECLYDLVIEDALTNVSNDHGLYLL
jgi:hypothetical protein